MRTVKLSPEIRKQRREEVKAAKANYALLKKDQSKFDTTRNELLVEFNNSGIPQTWGGLVFNGLRI